MADRRVIATVGSESEYSVVQGVSDVELAERVHSNSLRAAQRQLRRGSMEVYLPAAGCAVAGHAVVFGIRHVDVVVAVEAYGGWGAEARLFRIRSADCEEPLAARPELLEPVCSLLDNVEVVGMIDGDALGTQQELVAAKPVDFAVRRYLLNAMVAGIGDIKVAVAVDGDAARTAELAEGGAKRADGLCDAEGHPGDRNGLGSLLDNSHAAPHAAADFEIPEAAITHIGVLRRRLPLSRLGPPL